MTMEEKIIEVLKEHEEHQPIYTCRLQITKAILALISDSNQQAVIEERLRILKELNFEVVQPASNYKDMADRLFEWTKVKNEDSLKGKDSK